MSVSEERRDDLATPTPLLELAALLDHEGSPWGEVVPALGHWLYFHPTARQSELRADGHPNSTPLLPADLPPRRMWAGSRVRFLRPIPVGARLQRRSTIGTFEKKAGRSGPLTLIGLHHVVSVEGEPALIEDQDLIYRQPAAEAPKPPAAVAPQDTKHQAVAPQDTKHQAVAPDYDPGPADAVRDITLDATALFRYSALTFNAHRIHYDRHYAVAAEGYDGLVAQGPYLATLLIDHFRRHRPDAVITAFAFRGRQPVIAEKPARLCLRHNDVGAGLWIECGGSISLTAEVRTDPDPWR